MSLSDIHAIENVKIRIGGTDREYMAEKVLIERQWVGKRRRLADHSNRIFTDGYHLVITIEGQDIEQVGGSARDPRQIQLDLEGDATVLFYPDASQPKSFEVIAGDNVAVLMESEFGARADADQITMTTRDPLSRSDIEWFIK